MLCTLSPTSQVSFALSSLPMMPLGQGFPLGQSQELRRFVLWRSLANWRENSEAYMLELSAISAIQVSIREIESMSPDHIVISPGPCTPSEAGLSCQIIETFGPYIPVLGVCLGHQAIGQTYGGHVLQAAEPMHGKTSLMYHEGQGVF